MDPPSHLYHRNQQPNNDWDTMNDSWDQAPAMDFGYQPPVPPTATSQQAQHSARSTPQFNNAYSSNAQYSMPQSPSYDPYAKTGFDDHFSSGQGYGQGAGFEQFGAQFANTMAMSAPMVDAARSYGEQFAKQQTEKISAALSASHVKFYFQVDNAYVGKKLALLLFPFAPRDWSLSYSSGSEPIPPRIDVNAPDLYIPLMAIVTYISVAGLVLGMHNRFTPEHLGLIASNVLAWLVVENLILTVTKYVMNIAQSLGVWNSLAFSTYKFVAMTLCLLAYTLLSKSAYYAVLLYSSIAVAFFLIRSVKSYVMDSIYHSGEASKRKMYLIAYIALTQPFIMWWLTSSVISAALGPRSGWSLFGSTGYRPTGLEDVPEDMLRNDGVIP